MHICINGCINKSQNWQPLLTNRGLSSKIRLYSACVRSVTLNWSETLPAT